MVIMFTGPAISRSSHSSHDAGFGTDKRGFFWIISDNALTERLHVAFAAKERASVAAFYAAAIWAGGKVNGPPGLRPHYYKAYFGAFVLDPDGHTIEAVLRGPL